MGVGGPAGAMLLSAGADGLIQKATAGAVDYAEVAVSGLTGAVSGAGLAARAGLAGFEAAAAGRGLDGALNGAQAAVSYYTGPGPHTAAGALAAIGSATAIGALTGGGGHAANGAAQAAETRLTTTAQHQLADTMPTPDLPSTLYRGGRNTPSTFAPRVVIDDNGLSLYNKPLHGPNQVLDVSSISDQFDVVADPRSPGHYLVNPRDISQMVPWQNSRRTGAQWGDADVHQLTDGLHAARIGSTEG